MHSVVHDWSDEHRRARGAGRRAKWSPELRADAAAAVAVGEAGTHAAPPPLSERRCRRPAADVARPPVTEAALVGARGPRARERRRQRSGCTRPRGREICRKAAKPQSDAKRRSWADPRSSLLCGLAALRPSSSPQVLRSPSDESATVGGLRGPGRRGRRVREPHRPARPSRGRRRRGRRGREEGRPRRERRLRRARRGRAAAHRRLRPARPQPVPRRRLDARLRHHVAERAHELLPADGDVHDHRHHRLPRRHPGGYALLDGRGPTRASPTSRSRAATSSASAPSRGLRRDLPRPRRRARSRTGSAMGFSANLRRRRLLRRRRRRGRQRERRSTSRAAPAASAASAHVAHRSSARWTRRRSPRTRSAPSPPASTAPSSPARAAASSSASSRRIRPAPRRRHRANRPGHRQARRAEPPLPGVDIAGGWAFAFWGGDFYTFTAPDGRHRRAALPPERRLESPGRLDAGPHGRRRRRVDLRAAEVGASTACPTARARDTGCAGCATGRGPRARPSGRPRSRGTAARRAAQARRPSCPGSAPRATPPA